MLPRGNAYVRRIIFLSIQYRKGKPKAQKARLTQSIDAVKDQTDDVMGSGISSSGFCLCGKAVQDGQIVLGKRQRSSRDIFAQMGNG